MLDTGVIHGNSIARESRHGQNRIDFRPKVSSLAWHSTAIDGDRVRIDSVDYGMKWLSVVDLDREISSIDEETKEKRD